MTVIIMQPSGIVKQGGLPGPEAGIVFSVFFPPGLLTKRRKNSIMIFAYAPAGAGLIIA